MLFLPRPVSSKVSKRSRGYHTHLLPSEPLRGLSARDRRGVGGGGLLQQSDLGAEISPHVTRAGDTIHDVGSTQAMGPDLVPSHCGQEGKRWGDPKTPH